MSIASVVQERQSTCWPLHAPMKPPKLDGIQTLVVDDNVAAGMLLDIFLRRLGAEVVVVESVADAIRCFRSSPPSLLISDIWLKDGNGHELIQWIRSLSDGHLNAIPAVALSADVTVQNQQASLISGFQAFVPKPIRLSALVLTLHHVLEQSTTRWN